MTLLARASTPARLKKAEKQPDLTKVCYYTVEKNTERQTWQADRSRPQNKMSVCLHQDVQTHRCLDKKSVMRSFMLQ